MFTNTNCSQVFSPEYPMTNASTKKLIFVQVFAIILNNFVDETLNNEIIHYSNIITVFTFISGII